MRAARRHRAARQGHHVRHARLSLSPCTVEHRLFVDDFVIESSRNLVRQWHQATVQSMGVVVPDQPWERGGANRLTARPFGGGALYELEAACPDGATMGL